MQNLNVHEDELTMNGWDQPPVFPSTIKTDEIGDHKSFQSDVGVKTKSKRFFERTLSNPYNVQFVFPAGGVSVQKKNLFIYVLSVLIQNLKSI